MVCVQNGLTLLVGIAIGLRVVAAAASAVRTQVALFAIRGQAIAGKVDAAAMPTGNFGCNHREEDTISPLIEPLPKIC